MSGRWFSKPSRVSGKQTSCWKEVFSVHRLQLFVVVVCLFADRVPIECLQRTSTLACRQNTVLLCSFASLFVDVLRSSLVCRRQCRRLSVVVRQSPETGTPSIATHGHVSLLPDTQTNRCKRGAVPGDDNSVCVRHGPGLGSGRVVTRSNTAHCRQSQVRLEQVRSSLSDLCASPFRATPSTSR